VDVASSSDRAVRAPRRIQALLLSPLVILFASAARLLIISNYDTTTATTVAASSGVVGTLLGTIVPLLPLFLPAIVIFFVIFRQWGLVVLTALLTAFVSPAYYRSVVNALEVTANEAGEIWRGLLDVYPNLQDEIVDMTESIWGWLEIPLGFMWNWFEEFLRGLGMLDDNRELRTVLNEWRRVLALEWPDFLGVWNGWPWWVKVAAICALATLVWTLYAPPWNYFPRGGLFSETRQRISKLTRWPNTAVRIFGIAAYSVILAATCGLFVLYVHTLYGADPDRDRNVTSEMSEILRRPWLPAEEIQLSAGGPPLVGYTLSITSGWHVLLDERTRTIRYLRATEVATRTVCRLTEPTEAIPSPLIELEGVVPGKVPICFT